MGPPGATDDDQRRVDEIASAPHGIRRRRHHRIGPFTTAIEDAHPELANFRPQLKALRDLADSAVDQLSSDKAGAR